MTAEMGEYLVGSWFEFIENCDVVSYNVRFPGEGIKALSEFDVLGLDFKENIAYLCEVATHILGFLYGGKTKDSVAKINTKFERQKRYAKDYLKTFKTVRFQFWAPKVMKKDVEALKKIKGLELVINEEYSFRVSRLKEEAKRVTKQVNNPAFRLLQILEHLK